MLQDHDRRLLSGHGEGGQGGHAATSPAREGDASAGGGVQAARPPSAPGPSPWLLPLLDTPPSLRGSLAGDQAGDPRGGPGGSAHGGRPQFAHAEAARPPSALAAWRDPPPPPAPGDDARETAFQAALSMLPGVTGAGRGGEGGCEAGGARDSGGGAAGTTALASAADPPPQPPPLPRSRSGSGSGRSSRSGGSGGAGATPSSPGDGPLPAPPRTMTRLLRTACVVFDFLRTAGPAEESAVRRALGNTQDVSKGLRRLVSDRLVRRTGRGGRQAPFMYEISARARSRAHWASAIPPPVSDEPAPLVQAPPPPPPPHPHHYRGAPPVESLPPPSHPAAQAPG